MKYPIKKRMPTLRRQWFVRLGGLVLFVLLPLSGCLFFLLPFEGGHCWSQLPIEGRVVDAVTLAPATDVFLGIRAERDGKVIRFSSPTTEAGEPTNPLPEADGGFSFFLDSQSGGCPPTSSVPDPDIVTLLIVRGACSEEIVLDIANESVVRTVVLEESVLRTETITITEPILVSPCEE